MAVQTEYRERLSVGRAGMIADTSHRVVLSRTIEGAAVEFGKPLAQGAADKGARLVTTGDTAVVGITVEDRSAADEQYAVNASAGVMTKGALYVTVAATVAAGDPVHVIVADGTFSNTGGVELDATYETSATSGNLAVIRLA